jgi:hypothetical protein
MPIPLNKELYEYARKQADRIYKKSSAYKSGYIVKLYKRLGGEYLEDNKEHSLSRWFEENWMDVGNGDYPVYRPTVRISRNTPLTIDEIDKGNLKKQIELKQSYRGYRNLPPFLEKRSIF